MGATRIASLRPDTVAHRPIGKKPLRSWPRPRLSTTSSALILGEFRLQETAIAPLIPVLSDRTSDAVLETQGSQGAGEPDL